MAIKQLLTVADYDDYVRHVTPEAPTPELINGRIVVAARPVVRHARYLRQILRALSNYIDEHHLAGEAFPEIEVVLDEHNVVVPDLVYVARESPLGRLTDQRLYGAPEWACEIASPSTWSLDTGEKYLAYLGAGVREYWLVNPDLAAGERFQVFERVEEGTVSGKPTFRHIEGGPAALRPFPGIQIDAALL